jgi:mannose-6-phosphate isomerase-like protein (cupin superfamily)
LKKGRTIADTRRPGVASWRLHQPINSKDKRETKTTTEYVGAIEKQTLKNTFFRQVLFTAQHSQLVVMCLRPGEEIGDEVHPKVDQFFRIERGEAKFVFNEKEERPVRDGDAVVVPAGTYHNVVNTSKTAMLKLYTIYSPPNHPDGTIHKTKAEAEAAELVGHH